MTLFLRHQMRRVGDPQTQSGTLTGYEITELITTERKKAASTQNNTFFFSLNVCISFLQNYASSRRDMCSFIGTAAVFRCETIALLGASAPPTRTATCTVPPAPGGASFRVRHETQSSRRKNRRIARSVRIPGGIPKCLPPGPFTRPPFRPVL